MPPQQPDRLLDLVDDILQFRAHGSPARAITTIARRCSDCAGPTQWARRRAEARARPGHERVAADAMALRHLADASHRVVSYSPCQTAQSSSVPARFVSGFLSFFFSFVAAGPRARGLAERRETSQPCMCRAVTRDATLARRGPSRATGRPASRRSAVALSALHRLPARGLACGRADAKAPRPPGIAARLRCRAFRIRGYHPRATPHPAPPSRSLLESAPHERDLRI